MKICAMSDLHGYEIIIPKCDVLAMAGDISKAGDDWWFNEIFIPYLEKFKSRFDVCILVFGNHDDNLQFSTLSNIPEYLKILTDKSYKYKGIKFYGSPYCKKAPEIIDTKNTVDEKILKQIFSEIPLDTDILITHNPPYGIGDTVKNQSYHLGSESLTERIKQVKPKIHIFGHIHTGRKYTKEKETEYYNVSVLDENYNFIYKPTIINVM